MNAVTQRQMKQNLPTRATRATSDCDVLEHCLDRKRTAIPSRLVKHLTQQNGISHVSKATCDRENHSDKTLPLVKLTPSLQRWLTIGENTGRSLRQLKTHINSLLQRKTTPENPNYMQAGRSTRKRIASIVASVFGYLPLLAKKINSNWPGSQQYQSTSAQKDDVSPDHKTQQSQHLDESIQERIRRYKACGL